MAINTRKTPTALGYILVRASVSVRVVLETASNGIVYFFSVCSNMSFSVSATEGEDHHEKKSVLKKVKDKAKKIKDTITKHGHGQHHDEHGQEFDEEDDEDEEMAEEPVVQGGQSMFPYQTVYDVDFVFHFSSIFVRTTKFIKRKKVKW